MQYEDNPRSIKFYVKRYLHENKQLFKGKTVVDFPAGNGVTTKILQNIEAHPVPLDLFPEYFRLEDIECIKADIDKGLPLENATADALVCQEGIEHFSDQLGAFREFNRLLKKQGTLLITTPNYSNIQAKLSYLVAENEKYNAKMPPNEIDSIWMSDQDQEENIYFGHAFLIGIQKLRLLAKLSGFKIKKIHPTRVKKTSLLWFPVFYPFILLSNKIALYKNFKQKKNGEASNRKAVYKELYKLAVNPRILLDSHLMIEFIKEKEEDEQRSALRGIHAEFGIT